MNVHSINRGMNVHSALYRGELMHARHDAFARAFRYPAYMAAIDPAELPELDRTLRLFSYNRANLFTLAERDYTTPLASATPTRLVTNLRALGYVFNPVSFFLRYDGVAPHAMVAEVNNTYGGRRCYALGAEHRLPGTQPAFRVERDFFVSPFLHGELVYEFILDAPLDGERLAIEMHVRDTAGKRVFTARFTGTRSPLTDRALAAAALRFPLMSAQVIGLIHWQALKLRLLGAPYHRPGRDHRPRRI
jgi:DUF1365 family protein